jgi:hypothetical protein
MVMTLNQSLLTVLISASVSAVALGSYDRLVRQPRTPRLAVVDVGTLFAQIQHGSSVSTVRAPVGKTGESDSADFGPRLQAALEATARQCSCTLVAMPAVFGVGAGVPDLTVVVRDRMTLASAAPVGVPAKQRLSNDQQEPR